MTIISSGCRNRFRAVKIASNLIGGFSEIIANPRFADLDTHAQGKALATKAIVVQKVFGSVDSAGYLTQSGKRQTTPIIVNRSERGRIQFSAIRFYKTLQSIYSEEVSAKLG